MADIQTEHVTLSVAGGSSMRAYVARPRATRKCPGLMVFQEAFGVNEHIRDVAERVAREGYLAIAPELFHRTAAPGAELSYADFPSVLSHIQALSNEMLDDDIRAAYDWLCNDAQADPARIGCVGFCLGGRTAFQACAAVPLQAAVSFYGGSIGPGGRGPGLLHLAPKMQAPILMFWGGLDKHITPEQTRPVEEALKQAGKEYVNVTISFADHAFLREAGAAYNPRAAALAWTLMGEFFERYVRNAGE